MRSRNLTKSAVKADVEGLREYIPKKEAGRTDPSSAGVPFILSRAEARAFGLNRLCGVSAYNADVLGAAAALFIVYTIRRLTFHLQAVFRGLKEVAEHVYHSYEDSSLHYNPALS